MNLSIASSLCICVTLAVGTSLAPAQNFYGAGVGAETAARAGIYETSPDAPTDALILNPAGLGYLSARTIDLTIKEVFARGSFSNASNNNSPMSPNHGFVPSGAIGSPIGKHWAFGIGIMPDLISASKWRYADTPGFAGTTYGPQSEKSQILTVRATGGVAYSVSDRLSVGASIGGDYNANTLDSPYIFQSFKPLAGLKTLLNLHTTGYGWNTSYGVVAKPSRRTEFGFSFRTPTSITSHGTAAGNIGAEFQTLGLNAPPEFAYRAKVHIESPPSALLSASWKATRATRLSFQSDWIGWRGAFRKLPVTLTDGTNADINNLLKSNGFQDVVPLEWKDQIVVRGALERTLGETIVVGAGFLHATNPVPSSTLSPLTAAIMQNGLTAGAGWHVGKLHFNAAYGYNFTAKGRVVTSALLYNEYRNSTTKIGTQGFTLTTSFHP